MKRVPSTHTNVRKLTADQCNPVPQAAKAGVKVRVEASKDLDERFIGDSHRVQQIMANYLDNGTCFLRVRVLEVCASLVCECAWVSDVWSF